MTCHVVKFQICHASILLQHWFVNEKKNKKIKILLYIKADSTIQSEHLLRHLSIHSLSLSLSNFDQNHQFAPELSLLTYFSINSHHNSLLLVTK